MANEIIMSWSKVEMTIGKTLADDAMATSLTSVGTIKDRSTTLEAEEGDRLEAVATGGRTVAAESLEGDLTIQTTIIEPNAALFVSLGLGELASSPGADSSETLQVKTHIIPDDYSVKLTPRTWEARASTRPSAASASRPRSARRKATRCNSASTCCPAR